MPDVKNISAKLPADIDSIPIQVLRVAGSTNLAYSVAANNNNALPSGTEVVMVSTIEPIWVKFGASGVTISAGESGAILIPGGGVSLALNPTDTHVALIRAGTVDGTASFCKMT